MRPTQVSRIDLNLLPALDALLEEGSVTGAARRLNLTQSAVSRALSRLRAVFGDELFVRSGRGLASTRLARELAAPLRRSLGEVEALLGGRAGFEPTRARRRFSVAAIDYSQLVVLAPLARRLAARAPGVELDLRQVSEANDQELERGELDLLLSPRQPSGTGIVWTPLHDDGYVCLVAATHPLRRLPLDAYARLPHVLVAPRGRPGGAVDELLAARGLARRVAVQIPGFLLLPHVLDGTERVATVPARMARLLARRHPLRLLAAPVEIPRFTMCQAWHEVHRDDAGHRWLRGEVARAARALASR